MRHHDHNRKLGREKGQRKALLSALAKSLLAHSKITTTEARAKELRPFVEKMMTKSGKTGGGYTRIIKMPQRKSDGSKMAVIQII